MFFDIVTTVYCYRIVLFNEKRGLSGVKER